MPDVPLYNLANLLTFFRLLLVPVYISLMLYHLPGWALLAFSVAAVTDFFDGLAARRLGLATPLGAVLDPAADKLLCLSACVLLAMQGHVPLWMAVAFIARDIIVVLAYAAVALVQDRRAVRPSWWGKTATALQMLVLALFMLVDWLGLWQGWMPVLVRALAAVVLVTLASGLDYLLRGLLRQGREGPGGREGEGLG